jgi:glycerol uptake facilitator-like aquaporin
LPQILLKVAHRLSSNQRKFIAEVIGTFIVVVFATGSVVIDAKLNGRLGVPFIAFAPFVGIAIGVYLFGKTSIAQFNPAVTVGFMITRHIVTRIQLVYYFTAEIGENSSFAIFGYKTISGVVMGYVIGYILSTFTTFATILGRYNYDSDQKMCSCCSVLEENDNSKGFILNLLRTFRNFVVGIKKMPQLHKQPNFMSILKTSIIILITAESACIITAETVGLFLYKHSIFLSIPLSLLAGAFTVAVPEAYRRTKRAMEPIQSDGFVTFRA